MTRRDRSDLRATMIGSVLVGGALLHMWFHSKWGEHDLTTIVALIVGTGVMFNVEIVNLIRAWRGKE